MKLINPFTSAAAFFGFLFSFQLQWTHAQQQGDASLSFGDIIRDGLRNAKAWEIEVKAQYTLSTSSAYGDCAFSPDKTCIAFPTRDEVNRTAIVIRRLEPPHELVNQIFIEGSSPQDLAWSPDGTRLAYITKRTDLHVIDIAAKKDHELPNIQVDSMQNSLVWESDGIIRAVARLEGERDKLINLDDLTSKTAPSQAPIKDAHAHAKFATPMDMRGEQFQPGDSNDSEVLLVSKDETFARRFLEKQGDHGFWSTPDLRFAARGVRNTDLVLFVLGVRASPHRYFTANINVPTELVRTSRDREHFETARKHRLFYADVFPPKMNPLNGKVIGPDYDRPLAVVRLGAWSNATVEAELTFELDGYSQYVASKDAVLTIGRLFANSPSGHHVGYPRDAWFILQPKGMK